MPRILSFGIAGLSERIGAPPGRNAISLTLKTLLPSPLGRWIAPCHCVSTASLHDLNDELLHRIEEISVLCERIEQAVEVLVERHGDRSETVHSARRLQDSVAALKRELLQHYLEYRIADAARIAGAANN